MENEERSGRSSWLTPRDPRKLYCVAQSDRKRSLQEVTNMWNEYMDRPVSYRTVQRKFYETKYPKCVVKIASEFATTVSKKVWHGVNWIDTKLWIISGMDSRVLIWRRSDKEWTPPCLNPGRGVRVSLMIWDCIAFEVWVLWQLLTVLLMAKNMLKPLITFCGPFISLMTIICFKMIMYKTRVVKEYITETHLYGMELPSQSHYLNIMEKV